MNRIVRRWLAACVFLAAASSCAAQVTTYHDRALFTAALAGLSLFAEDDFESYTFGPIALSDARGDFAYTYDPALTQPAIVPGGNGGHALGGSPFDVFVGGDSVTVTAGPGSSLAAFGADLLYAPSFDTVPADTYRLGIANGSAAGQIVGNLDSIDPAGGTFFLGLIADPGFEFTAVILLSVQPDPSFLVPAYQVDNLIYGGAAIVAAVPEPDTALIPFLAGAAVWLVRARRVLTHRERRMQ